ncbi:hypothetical protein Hanom_Chr08g00722081 [Helianthus anomalus]
MWQMGVRTITRHVNKFYTWNNDFDSPEKSRQNVGHVKYDTYPNMTHLTKYVVFLKTVTQHI